MPFHIHSIHTYTCAQFPRNDDEGAYAAARQESAQKNRPRLKLRISSDQIQVPNHPIISRKGSGWGQSTLFLTISMTAVDRIVKPRGHPRQQWLNNVKSLQKYPQESSKTYLWRARPFECTNRRGGTNRCGRGGIRSRQSMMLLSIAMRPIRTCVHMLRRRGMTLVLRHLMPLGLIRRVGRRIGGAVGRERRIYRNGRVRL